MPRTKNKQQQRGNGDKDKAISPTQMLQITHIEETQDKEEVEPTKDKEGEEKNEIDEIEKERVAMWMA